MVLTTDRQWRRVCLATTMVSRSNCSRFWNDVQEEYYKFSSAGDDDVVFFLLDVTKHFSVSASNNVLVTDVEALGLYEPLLTEAGICVSGGNTEFITLTPTS